MTPEEKQQVLKELGGIPEEVYNDLIKELIPTLKSQANELKDLLNQNNLDQIGEVAHSIKGSAGNFRVRNVHEVAANVEKAAKDKEDAESINQHILELEQAIENFEQDF